MKETVHFTIGPLLGEQLLEIAQTNIAKGNVEYGSSIYQYAFGEGFTKDLMLKVLKNQLVVVTDNDGVSVNLVDDLEHLDENAYNIFDWKHIIDERFKSIIDIRESLINNDKKFHTYYSGDIEDYSILEMMKRYYNDEEMKVMSGKANIAARIIGSTDGKICDKGYSNPTDIWEKMEDRIEWNESDAEKWEKILYYTVKHVSLIKNLYKEFKNFESTYFFLVDNGFIERPAHIELFFENTLSVLKNFCNTEKGYYHPLCNTGLYEYKTWLFDELLKSRTGNEFMKYGILKKNILDGYDAGWLSPEGDFYGGNGETSNMIHQTIADQMFRGNEASPISNAMTRDGVTDFGSESADYWLEKHGWIKIHHDEIYGSFIGYRNPEERTKDFPYHYCPTEVQIKMICEYADKFYHSKMYTQPQIVRHTEPITTYKLRQMDDIQLHEIFGH